MIIIIDKFFLRFLFLPTGRHSNHNYQHVLLLFSFLFYLDDDHKFENLSVSYSQEGYVHYVVDAVFTLVLAISKLVDEKCGNFSKIEPLCTNFYPFDGKRLLSVLRNVTFRNGK